MRASCAGLTLLELVVASALGMLVIAAAMTVLLGAQQNLRAQSSMGELQQNAHLNFELLARDIRQSNLNMSSIPSAQTSHKSTGIIFSQADLPQSITQNIATFATQQALTKAGTVENSDQLLIQYLPKYQSSQQNSAIAQQEPVVSTRISAGLDCEGRLIEFIEDNRETRPVIVNRYYLAKDPQQSADQPIRYSLFCESGWYRVGDQVITGLNGGGQQLIKGVEAFKIRLGVQNAKGQLAYMGVTQYQQLMVNANLEQLHNIVSIEVGLLIRASMPLARSSNRKPIATIYQLAGQQLTLDQTGQGNKNYLRQSISQVIALRNAQGVGL